MKSKGQFSLLVMMAVIICSCALSGFSTAASTGYYDRNYVWDYGGERWTWTLSIPQSLYDSYRGISQSTRVSYGPSDYGFFTTTSDSYVIRVANELHDAAVRKGYDTFGEVSFALAFVQGLTYTSDSVATGYDEYQRFPIETLVDEGGDCEDTAILFAAIVLIMDYDTIFISLPSHVAVGVWGHQSSGNYYTLNDRKYFYCETTGDGWGIGDMPNEYKNVGAHLYTIDQTIQYVPGQNVGNRISPLNPWLIILGGGACIAGVVIALRERTRKQKIKEALSNKSM